MEIKEILEAEKLESSIYITVDTLKYLKRGGRITPAAAAIGTVLNLKPVLQIQGEKLDAFAKVRGWKQAKKTMLDAMEKICCIVLAVKRWPCLPLTHAVPRKQEAGKKNWRSVFRIIQSTWIRYR